jgi:predicted Holliday junction resolvase-like endonuclease
MIELIAGVVFIVAVLATVAALFKNEANLQKIRARLEADRADQAEATVAQRRRADDAMRQTQERHRAEQVISEEKLARGDRDHLDNDW